MREVKELPILFTGPMVRAILEGRKTQTRRLVKHQPPGGARILVERYNPTVVDRHGEEQPGPEIYGAYSDDGEWGCKCPYGQPLDRLWVRETFNIFALQGDNVCAYRATCQDDEFDYVAGNTVQRIRVGRWRPSIFMPRRASRITLEITGIRVERLQAISEKDCIAEGCEHPGVPIGPEFMSMVYRRVWTTINGADSWHANPYVWVIEFHALSVEAPK